jgi:hypothetical protein
LYLSFPLLSEGEEEEEEDPKGKESDEYPPESDFLHFFVQLPDKGDAGMGV